MAITTSTAPTARSSTTISRFWPTLPKRSPPSPRCWTTSSTTGCASSSRAAALGVVGVSILSVFIVRRGITDLLRAMTRTMMTWRRRYQRRDPTSPSGIEVGDMARAVDVLLLNAIEWARAPEHEAAAQPGAGASKAARWAKMAEAFEAKVGGLVHGARWRPRKRWRPLVWFDAPAPRRTNIARRISVAASAEPARQPTVQTVALATEELGGVWGR